MTLTLMVDYMTIISSMLENVLNGVITSDFFLTEGNLVQTLATVQERSV